MTSRRFAPLLLVAALLLGCTRETSVPAEATASATPEATATPLFPNPLFRTTTTPTPSPTGSGMPMATAAATSPERPLSRRALTNDELRTLGRFLVTRGGEWWLVTPGHPADDAPLGIAPRQVTFSGLSSRAGGGTEMHYLVQESGYKERGEFVLYGYSLPAGPTRKLLEFPGEPRWSRASVAPDAERVAYSNGADVVVRHLSTAAERVVDRTEACDEAGRVLRSPCRKIQVGPWSADARMLNAQDTYYEGGRSYSLDLSADPAVSGPGSDFGGWAPSGHRLCTTGWSQAPTSEAFVVEPPSSHHAPIPLVLPTGFNAASALTCRWSASGAVAVWYGSYHTGERRISDGRRIGVFDSQLTPIVHLDIDEWSLDRWSMNPQFLILRGSAEAPRGSVPGTTWAVLDLTGALAQLDLDADALIAVLPN